MKGSDVSTYFSTVRVQIESNCHDKKCQQIDYCLAVMIKG